MKKVLKMVIVWGVVITLLSSCAIYTCPTYAKAKVEKKSVDL
jgi:hypothetical protein